MRGSPAAPGWVSIGTIPGYAVVAVIGLAALAIIAHQLRELR